MKELLMTTDLFWHLLAGALLNLKLFLFCVTLNGSSIKEFDIVSLRRQLWVGRFADKKCLKEGCQLF